MVRILLLKERDEKYINLWNCNAEYTIHFLPVLTTTYVDISPLILQVRKKHIRKYETKGCSVENP